MNYKKRDRVTSLILIIIMALLLGYNLYKVQIVRTVVWAREEYHGVLEAQQLEKIAMRQTIKDHINSKKYQEQETSRGVVEFNEKYIPARDSFLDKVESLSVELDSGVVNIEEIKSLTNERIKASEKFKEEILLINAALEPLEIFYGAMLEFLEKDIENWNLVLSYYSGSELQEGLQLKYIDTIDLYHKAEEERIRVYLEHGIE